MARRLFNGRAFSEDGWPYVDQDSCTWGAVPGTNPPVRLQIQQGLPYAMIMAWAADWNAYVEPLRDADSACWTPGNSVATSNHPGGTACDLNWDNHKYGVSMSGFNAQQQATMKEMEDFYEGNMFWSQRWFPASYVDPMHSQCGYDTYDQDNDRPQQKVYDFCARKIRADGFSTFRRGNDHIEPPPVPQGAQILANATGITLTKAQAILPEVQQGLALSQCTTVNRIAYWLAQMGHESGSFVYTEEIQSGDESTDRWKYKGRTWIQITWQSNYAAFSQWLYGKGLTSSPTYFVDNPKELAQLQWAALGPAWYWTVARAQINSLCDAGNFTQVTQLINGGQNGASDRVARRDRALALGDQLLALTTDAPPVEGDDDLSAEAERMIAEMYAEYKKEKKGPSRGFFAPDANPVDSPLGFLYNIDGNVWNQEVTWGYLFGVQRAEELVNTVAQNGVAPASWAGQLTDAQGLWLAEWGQQWCLGLISFRAAIQKAFKAAGAAPAGVTVQSADPVLSTAQAQDIANRSAAAVAQQVQNAVSRTPAVLPPVPTVELATQPADEAENFADLYRSLKSLGLADALPIEARAPLAAFISILQTKNGTQV
jgi:predicted chitinase